MAMLYPWKNGEISQAAKAFAKENCNIGNKDILSGWSKFCNALMCLGNVTDQIQSESMGFPAGFGCAQVVCVQLTAVCPVSNAEA